MVFYKGKRLVKTEKAVCRKTDEPAARFPGKDRRGVSRIKKGVANALIEKIGMKMLARVPDWPANEHQNWKLAYRRPAWKDASSWQGRRRGRFPARGFRRKDLQSIPPAYQTGIGVEKGEIRRPDVRGNENDIRAALRRDFQKIPAIQPQDGVAVRMKVADLLQALWKGLRFGKAWHQQYVMYFTNAAVFLIDRADFARKEKSRTLGVWHGKRGIRPVFRAQGK